MRAAFRGFCVAEVWSKSPRFIVVVYTLPMNRIISRFTAVANATRAYLSATGEDHAHRNPGIDRGPAARGSSGLQIPDGSGPAGGKGPVDRGYHAGQVPAAP